jgi:hypothetical protein
MVATHTDRGQHPAREAFFVRLTIALMMACGFLMTVSLIPTDLP